MAAANSTTHAGDGMAAQDTPGFDKAAVGRARKRLEREESAIPDMAAFYRLLANASRLRILLTLGRVEQMCVGDLAASIGLSIAATSQQLKILKADGWLATTTEGKQVFYRITSTTLRDALEGDLRLIRRKR